MNNKNNDLENKLNNTDTDYKKLKTNYDKNTKANTELQEKLNTTEINLINIKSKYDALLKDLDNYKNKKILIIKVITAKIKLKQNFQRYP